jgi:hypothetical protein
MVNQAEVREFHRTRRARVTPVQAGIVGGGGRRVTGLRREEVAMLAAVSTDYVRDPGRQTNLRRVKATQRHAKTQGKRVRVSGGPT